MTLPASGAISLGNVQAEFGGSTPISLSEYYKGGSYVAVGDTAPSVPASGAISLDNFHGAAKSGGPPPTLTVSLSTPAVYGSRTVPPSGPATTDTVTATASGGTGPYTYSWEWVSGNSFTTLNGSTATASWRTTIGSEVLLEGFYRCRVTDSLGAIGVSGDVQVVLEGIP